MAKLLPCCRVVRKRFACIMSAHQATLSLSSYLSFCPSVKQLYIHSTSKPSKLLEQEPGQYRIWQTYCQVRHFFKLIAKSDISLEERALHFSCLPLCCSRSWNQACVCKLKWEHRIDGTKIDCGVAGVTGQKIKNKKSLAASEKSVSKGPAHYSKNSTKCRAKRTVGFINRPVNTKKMGRFRKRPVACLGWGYS